MKRIQLDENILTKVINEVFNEISMGTIHDLANKNPYGYSNEFFTSDKDLEKAIEYISNSLEQYKEGYQNPEANQMFQAAVNGLESIKTYFAKKFKQGENMGDTLDYVSVLRGNPEYDEEGYNDPITNDEYGFVKFKQEKHRTIDAINHELERRTSNIKPFLPKHLRPHVWDYDGTVNSTNKLRLSIGENVEDFIGVVDEVMNKFGYTRVADEHGMIYDKI